MEKDGQQRPGDPGSQYHMQIRIPRERSAFDHDLEATEYLKASLRPEPRLMHYVPVCYMVLMN